MKNLNNLDAAEAALWRGAVTVLEGYGISAHLERDAMASDASVDAHATLSAGAASAEYTVIFKHALTATSVAATEHQTDLPVLAVGGRIGARSADALRAASIQFVDLAGNARIRFGGVLIDVRGRAGTIGSFKDRAVHRGTNLFSTRRSQVVAVVLAWPDLAGATVRDVARCAGVSTGQAHETLSFLRQSGFVNRSQMTASRSSELLKLWAGSYPRGLGRVLALDEFTGPAEVLPRFEDVDIYLSGESAEGVRLRRAETLTIYVDVWTRTWGLEQRWRRGASEAPNIFVRHKFWRAPSWNEGEHPRPAVQNAPWPMVYADLLSTEDGRLREVADAWVSEHA